MCPIKLSPIVGEFWGSVVPKFETIELNKKMKRFLTIVMLWRSKQNCAQEQIHNHRGHSRHYFQEACSIDTVYLFLQFRVREATATGLYRLNMLDR